MKVLFAQDAVKDKVEIWQDPDTGKFHIIDKASGRILRTFDTRNQAEKTLQNAPNSF